MLEPIGEVTNGLGELAVDCIARAARRRRVVCLIEDQQRA
jgi:hypothetical protein